MNYRSTFFLIFAILFSGIARVVAQPTAAVNLEIKLDRYMKSAVDHQFFSGNILISKNDKVIFHKSYGMANYELNVPNTLNTVYRTASLSKQFTSMAIMQLKEKGKLKLTDTLAKFLDHCPESWKSITLHQLLSHTSGIINFSSLPDWDDKYAKLPMDRLEIIDLIKDMPLQFAPGTKYKYCNTGYTLLSLVIEKVSGETYHQYLSQHLLKPLGMKHTSQITEVDLTLNKATGYGTNLHEFINVQYGDTKNLVGSGSLQSTTGDLLIWNRALHESKLVSKESTALMFTPNLMNYGYGHIITKRFEQDNINHAGADYGFSSYITTFPKEQLSIIVLSNSDKTSAGKVGNDLSAIILNQPYTNSVAGMPEMLAKTYKKSGVGATIRAYNELRNGSTFKATKDDELVEILYNLGYEMGVSGKFQDAIALLKFTVAEFPKDSYAHDILGETYFQSNDFEQALIYFKKALELNEKNEWAIRGIQKTEKKKQKKAS